MNVLLHHSENATKQLEVLALPRSERMLDEEWDDRPLKIAAPSHAIGCPVAVIHPDDSAAKIRLQRTQELDVAFVLHDGELGEHLAVRPHVGMN